MHNFPYTNFHELNLDWVIQETKNSKKIVEEADERISNAVDIANSAEAKASSAEAKANSSTSTAANAESKAVSAETKAVNAEAKAVSAETKAVNAETKATSAINSALNAFNTANDALTQANYDSQRITQIINAQPYTAKGNNVAYGGLLYSTVVEDDPVLGVTEEYMYPPLHTGVLYRTAERFADERGNVLPVYKIKLETPINGTFAERDFISIYINPTNAQITWSNNDGHYAVLTDIRVFSERKLVSQYADVLQYDFFPIQNNDGYTDMKNVSVRIDRKNNYAEVSVLNLTSGFDISPGKVCAVVSIAFPGII